MDDKMVLRRPTPSRPTTVRPSCPALVSNFFTEQEPDSDCRSFSQLLAGAMASSPPAGGSSAWATPAVAKETGNGVAVRPKTVRIKSMHPTAIPILPRSPYLDVSAGSTSSASALVDSPVDPGQTPAMATQSEPGNFPASPFVPGVSEAAGSESTKERILKQDGGSNVLFKPLAKVGTRNPMSPLASFGPFGISHQQALAQVQAQAQVQVYNQACAQIQTQSASSPSPVLSSAATSPQPQVASSSLAPSSALASATASNYIPSQQKALIQPETKQTIESPKPGSQSIEQIQRPLPPIPVGDRPSYDGYNWRKYGQKQVKGSEYPRSYYKCTHPNCPVKKKVERSHDGQVTEIVYKGEHNHLKPQPARRLTTGAHPYVSDVNGRDMGSPGGGSSDRNESVDVKVDQSSPGFTVDPRGGNERIMNISDPSTPVRGHGSPEQSFGLSDDDEDGSRADDGDDDEPDSKRRRKEKKVKDLVSLRVDQEPRVVLRTTTDADILEDGFRWRKYGQKVVKGNPHPRSYYKCTSVKCTVRKHVERASNDPKAVITTYEGKHNHDAPVTSAKKLQP